MAHVVGAFSERVWEVAAHSEAQTSHVVGNITQRLEKDIEAVVVSAPAMSKQNTRTTVDGLREKSRHN